MHLFDILIIIFISGFVIAGAYYGFIHALGSLLGTVFGLFLAVSYYNELGTWLMDLTGWQGNGAKIFMFIAAFLLIHRIVLMLMWLLKKVASVVTWLPFVTTLNRLSGALFGFVEGFISVSVAIYGLSFLKNEKVLTFFADSRWAEKLSAFGKYSLTWIPSVLSWINFSITWIFEAIKKIL